MPLEVNAWLNHPLHQVPEPDPCEAASVREYLRWMRIKRDEADPQQDLQQVKLCNNGEMLDLLDIWESNADYGADLDRWKRRTRRLAEVMFEVEAPWRIRVGGQRGPESMLLPALDAQGLPYLPSTTLKGVARAVAERDSSVDSAAIQRIFGVLEPEALTGSVVFLDAYPLALPQEMKPEIDDDDDEQVDEIQGLVPDMANSLWTWGEGGPVYRANPNVFLSLRQVRFLIGLRRGHRGTTEQVEQVKRWLVQGLQQGVGSRVNSGYGVLRPVKPSDRVVLPGYLKPWVRVQFMLRGQLSHGRQYFGKWQERRNNPDLWNPPGKSQVELRPTAFRSLLRYWFRVLALGKLPMAVVQRAELEIFGGIEPDPTWGLVQVLLENPVIHWDNASSKDEEAGKATGVLVVRPGREVAMGQGKVLRQLLRSLVWLMGHLGGVGKGARRPCYSRKNRSKPQPPYWRGTTLSLEAAVSRKAKQLSPKQQKQKKQEEEFWLEPVELAEFQVVFQEHLEVFYGALGEFVGQSDLADRGCIEQEVPQGQRFVEALDARGRIFVVSGEYSKDKPPALALLHKLAQQNGKYNRDLCGSTSVPSPIWVARVADRFDVVTVFGASQTDRARFVAQLQDGTYPVAECLRVL